MPIRDTIQTSTVSLGDLLANGRTFRVPPFQRNYSWSSVEWDDLWNDLLLAEQNERDHYLGAVVFQSSDERNVFEVIDGQQRLATLSVLAIALIKQFERWSDEGKDAQANRERAELFRDRLVSPRDPKSLKRTSRLQLNDNDDVFFQSAIVNGHAPTNVRRLYGRRAAHIWRL